MRGWCFCHPSPPLPTPGRHIRSTYSTSSSSYIISFFALTGGGAHGRTGDGARPGAERKEWHRLQPSQGRHPCHCHGRHHRAPLAGTHGVSMDPASVFTQVTWLLVDVSVAPCLTPDVNTACVVVHARRCVSLSCHPMQSLLQRVRPGLIRAMRVSFLLTGPHPQPTGPQGGGHGQHGGCAVTRLRVLSSCNGCRRDCDGRCRTVSHAATTRAGFRLCRAISSGGCRAKGV